MHLVETNADLETFYLAGVGYVFNDFTSGASGARYNVLHAADCTWVMRMLDRAEPRHQPTVRKMLFDTVDEAQLWLTENRGPEGSAWKRCGTCQPGRPSVPSPRRPEGASTSLIPNRTGRAATSRNGHSDRTPVTPVAFALPSKKGLRLAVAPRLDSWNKTGDPDQVKLTEYLAATDELLHPEHARLKGPLALRLDVGLPQGIALLEQRDLDNYLFPLATRLRRSIAGQLVSVWGTKRYSPNSYAGIEQAVPVALTGPFGRWHNVQTDRSAQTAAFKEQIRDQLAGTEPLPAGPVHLQLCFTVGPRRNWLTLWKPTIDALGQILGHAPTGAPWNPLDGRIVVLGLHNRIDPAIGNEVFITIAADHLQPHRSR
jgi:hypothetical protein